MSARKQRGPVTVQGKRDAMGLTAMHSVNVHREVTCNDATFIADFADGDLHIGLGDDLTSLSVDQLIDCRHALDAIFSAAT